jgi:hypothetical protein
VYTVARLLANPLTASYAEAFERLLELWAEVNAEELRMRAAIVRAQALVSAADDDLDALTKTILGAVLISYGNDRKHPEYLRYAGKKNMTQINRPVLGPQLEQVRPWPAAMRASGKEILVKLADELDAIIVRSDEAVAALTTAEQNNRDFRLVGRRRTFIDEVNAERTKTWGELSEKVHKERHLNLPNNFADQPFRPMRRKTKSLDDQIADTTKKLETLKAKKAEKAEKAEKNS